MKHTTLAILVLAGAHASAQTWQPSSPAPAGVHADIGPDGTAAFAWEVNDRAYIAVQPPTGPAWGRSVGDNLNWPLRVSAVQLQGQSVWLAGSSRWSGDDTTTYSRAVFAKSYPTADTVVAFGQNFLGQVNPNVGHSATDVVLAAGTVHIMGRRAFDGTSVLPVHWSTPQSQWTSPSGYTHARMPEGISPGIGGLYVELARTVSAPGSLWSAGRWRDGQTSQMYLYVGGAGATIYALAPFNDRGALTDLAFDGAGFATCGWNGQAGSEIGVVVKGTNPVSPTTAVRVVGAQPITFRGISSDGALACGTLGNRPLVYDVATGDAWQFTDPGEALRVRVVSGEVTVATRLADGSLRVDRGLSPCWIAVDVETLPLSPIFASYGHAYADDPPTLTYLGGIISHPRTSEAQTPAPPIPCDLSTGEEPRVSTFVQSHDALRGVTRALLSDAAGRVVWSWSGAGAVTVPLAGLKTGTYYLSTDVGSTRYVIVH